MNINLRRFGCAERSLLSYHPPSQAARDKFHRVTGIHSAVALPFDQCVFAIAKLVQHALVLLALFDTNYVDGLMCDSTNAALKQFYNEFGPFNDVEIEPGNWCDPMLITVVLRTVEIFKQKLSALGFAVKQGNELDGLPRQIKHFQKAQGLRITKVFDRRTIDRIEALYVRALPQTQAVAAVSSTVNVLRSKIEDITGLPTAAHRRGEDGDRDGTGSTAGSGSNEHDLEYFLSGWLRISKRTEKQQSRKRDKKGSGDAPGLTTNAGSGTGNLRSPGTAGGSPLSPISGAGTLTQPPVSLGETTSTLAPPSIARPASTSPTLQPEDPEDENQVHPKLRATPARVLRGIKDSTSRTLGGIVEKSKLVTKGMKQLAHTVKDAGMGHESMEDEGEDYVLESGTASFDLLDRQNSLGEKECEDEERDMVEDIIDRGRTPPLVIEGSGSVRSTKSHRRAMSLDSVKRDGLFRRKREGSVGKVEPAVRKALGGRHSVDFGSRADDGGVSGINTVARDQQSQPRPGFLKRRGTIDASPTTQSVNDKASSVMDANPPPSTSPRPSTPLSPPTAPSPPLALHPRIQAQAKALSRRINQLHQTLSTTIHPMMTTLSTQTDTLQTTIEFHMKDLEALESVVNALNERQKAVVEQVDNVENEVLRVRYAVGVCEERVSETEEAVAGFLSRVKAVEKWFVEKWGGEAKYVENSVR